MVKTTIIIENGKYSGFIADTITVSLMCNTPSLFLALSKTSSLPPRLRLYLSLLPTRRPLELFNVEWHFPCAFDSVLDAHGWYHSTNQRLLNNIEISMIRKHIPILTPLGNRVAIKCFLWASSAKGQQAFMMNKHIAS